MIYYPEVHERECGPGSSHTSSRRGCYPLPDVRRNREERISPVSELEDTVLRWRRSADHVSRTDSDLCRDKEILVSLKHLDFQDWFWDHGNSRPLIVFLACHVSSGNRLDTVEIPDSSYGDGGSAS